MDIAYTAYLLFVIPGFCLVWTYRHFVRAGKIGEFEYAAWSLLWGTFIFLVHGYLLKFGFYVFKFLFDDNSQATMNLQDPFSLLGNLVGMSLVIICIAFPGGYLGACLSKKGYFKKLDEFFFSYLRD